MGRKNGKFSNIQSDTVITGRLRSHRTTDPQSGATEQRSHRRIKHGNKHGNKHGIKHRIKHGIKHGIKNGIKHGIKHGNHESGKRIWKTEDVYEVLSTIHVRQRVLEDESCLSLSTISYSNINRHTFFYIIHKKMCVQDASFL